MKPLHHPKKTAQIQNTRGFSPEVDSNRVKLASWQKLQSLEASKLLQSLGPAPTAFHLRFGHHHERLRGDRAVAERLMSTTAKETDILETQRCGRSAFWIITARAKDGFLEVFSRFCEALSIRKHVKTPVAGSTCWIRLDRELRYQHLAVRQKNLALNSF